MKPVTIAAVPVAIARIELSIRDPGIVRHVAFERKPRLVMSKGEPNFEEVPVLFIEGQKDAPIRKHRFEIIEHGKWCEPAGDEVATWVATGISGGGLLVHVFEITELPS